MKKLLFVAALGVAGLMSAGVSKTACDTKAVKLLQNYEDDYDWITISSPCGAVYFLDGNDYCTMDDLMDDVNYFDGQKCG